MYITAKQLRLQKLSSTQLILCYKGGAPSTRIPPSKNEERIDSELVMNELRIAGHDNSLKTMEKTFVEYSLGRVINGQGLKATHCLRVGSH